MPTATTYMLMADGAVMHNHPLRPSLRSSYHSAYTEHSGPNLNIHNDYSSWDTSSDWSSQTEYVPDNQKPVLIGYAYTICTTGATPKRFTFTKPAISDDASTPELAAEVKTALQDQSDRLDQVEELVLATSNTAAQAATTANTVRDAVTAAVNAQASIRTMVEHQNASIEQVKQLVGTTIKHEVVITVQQPDKPTTSIEGIQHFQFIRLLRLAMATKGSDRNIWITGPAGSGKTTAAHSLSKALGLPGEAHSSIGSPYELTGVIYAQGNYKSSAFRRIYEGGGVILLDECDGSDPRALLILNQALSNSSMNFPDQTVQRHPDCVVLASANTWGFGGSSNYVARMKQDDAFLDRFLTLSWPYDEDLERYIATGSYNRSASTPADPPELRPVPQSHPSIPAWVSAVQATRKAAADAGAKIVISPRASIKGSQLLQAGLSQPEVVEATFGRYRDVNNWPSIGGAVEDFATARFASAPVTSDSPFVQDSRLKSMDFSKAQVFTQRPSYPAPYNRGR